MPDQPLTVVLCLDHAYVSGGQAKVAIDSAVGLKRAGARPIVVAAAGPVAEALTAEGVETRCLGQSDLVSQASRLDAAIQGTWNRRAVAALTDLFAEIAGQPAVVHVHAWAKALSPAIAQPIAASGLPAIYTIHEYFLFCPNGGFYNYQQSHVCRLQPLSAACWATHCDQRSYARKLWRNARLTLARQVLHFPEIFSDFVTISDFQREIVEPYLPAGARVHQLSNPILVRDRGPKSDPAAGKVIFVGRLSPEKGVFLFAEAARKTGLQPVFVGDGPAAEQLKSCYPEARLTGWQPAEAVQDLMRGARALVFPSLWYEGQPLTILEAKSLGLPVIVADTCAGRDEIEDGATGLWFKGGDAEDLARALRRAEDDALIERLSAAAYASFWAKPPVLERHVEGLVAIYRDMLARRRKPQSVRGEDVVAAGQASLSR